MAAAAGIIGGFAAYMGLYALDGRVDLNTFKGVFTQGLVGGVLGVAVVIGVFKLLKSRELGEVWTALNQKLTTKNKVVVAEPEKLDA